MDDELGVVEYAFLIIVIVNWNDSPAAIYLVDPAYRFLLVNGRSNVI